MAKARSAPGGPRPPRPVLPVAAAGRGGPVGYLRGVWEELKKVVWPARDELLRMTGIVIATVILFAVIIGGADYLLSLGVRQLYSGAANSTTTTTTNPAISPRVSAAPSTTAPTITVPSASARATP